MRVKKRANPQKPTPIALKVTPTVQQSHIAELQESQNFRNVTTKMNKIQRKVRFLLSIIILFFKDHYAQRPFEFI